MQLTTITAETFNHALEDDRNNTTFTGVWLEIPLTQAPLFKNFKEIWKTLESSYKQEMSALIWNEKLPTSKEIASAFEKVEMFLQKV